ncbi:MAG: prolipoprotein diacylglyceryl transferase [Planctomycetota bacterium]
MASSLALAGVTALCTWLSCLTIAPAVIEWTADPIAFEIGPVTVRWYGILFASGFIVGFMFMRGVFRREGKPDEDLDTLLLYLIVGTIGGARLGHCFFYHPMDHLQNPLLVLQFWKGGLASHGGVIGICIALWLYRRKRPGQPYLWLLDRLCVPAILTSAFIRIGNLFNSEIVGRPSDAPWAFVFHRYYNEFIPEETERLLPRHPTPIYESASYFLIFVVLMVIYRVSGNLPRRGLPAGIALTLAFTARFVIEFFKERQAAHTVDSTLSMGQWLSIPIVLVGLGLIVRALKNEPESPVVEATPADPSPAPSE